jgi:hypothetical protein
VTAVRVAAPEKVTYQSSHLNSIILDLMVLRSVNLNAPVKHILGVNPMARGKTEGKVTQKEMVQAALNEKGWEAGPAELKPVIKEKFHVDLANNIISNYKSVLKRKGGKGGGGGGKRGRKPGAQFSDLEAVRGLVSRLGADQVKKLVDMANMFA